MRADEDCWEVAHHWRFAGWAILGVHGPAAAGSNSSLPAGRSSGQDVPLSGTRVPVRGPRPSNGNLSPGIVKNSDPAKTAGTAQTSGGSGLELTDLAVLPGYLGTCGYVFSIHLAVFQRNSSGKARAPFVRVARGMKYGVDRDRSLRRLVKHGVWKAAYQGATVALVNDRVYLGREAGRFG